MRTKGMRFARVFIPAVFILFCTAAVLASDILSYKDDQGRLILVDSLSEVPIRYRNRLDVVPTGKDAEMLSIKLTKLILNNPGNFCVNRVFDRYIFFNYWTYLLLFLLFLTFLLPIFFEQPLSRLNIFIISLFFFLFFHLIVFVPKLQQRIYCFSGVLNHIQGISFPVGAGIRYKVLSYRIHTEELPLIPVNIYAEILDLRKIQESIRIQK